MLLVSVIHLHFNCTTDFLYSFLKCTLFISLQRCCCFKDNKKKMKIVKENCREKLLLHSKLIVHLFLCVYFDN